MKKRMVILLVVALMVVISAGPTMAAQKRTNRVTEGLPGKQYFTMVGFITGKGVSAIGVEVIHGNRFSKSLIGTVKRVWVDPSGKNTEFLHWTPFGCVESDWDAVVVGDTVSVHGYVVNKVFEANRVTVGVPLDCCTP